MGLIQYGVFSRLINSWIVAFDLKTLAYYLVTHNESGVFAVVSVAEMSNARHVKAPFNFQYDLARNVESYRTNSKIVIDQGYAYVDNKRFRLFRPVKKPADMLLEV